jgi:hypothetical protein
LRSLEGRRRAVGVALVVVRFHDEVRSDAPDHQTRAHGDQGIPPLGADAMDVGGADLLGGLKLDAHGLGRALVHGQLAFERQKIRAWAKADIGSATGVKHRWS